MNWPADPQQWNLAFGEWLEKNCPEWDSCLAAWFDRFDLPADGGALLPHGYLQRGLRAQTGMADPVAPLAIVVAKAIERVSFDNGDGYLFNLFYLTASLGRPGLLSEPLQRMTDRLSSEIGSRPLFGGREDPHSGALVSEALRLALLWNQSDTKWFEPVWMPMIEERHELTIAGSWMDGIEGVVRLPGGWQGLRNPFLGRAIKARHPAPEGNWQEFDAMLDRICRIGGFAEDRLWKPMQEVGCSPYAILRHLDPRLIFEAKEFAKRPSRRVAPRRILPESEVEHIIWSEASRAFTGFDGFDEHLHRTAEQGWPGRTIMWARGGIQTWLNLRSLALTG